MGIWGKVKREITARRAKHTHGATLGGGDSGGREPRNWGVADMATVRNKTSSVL
jgi:hypothetical protein